MEGILIVNVINVADNKIIEDGVYRLSRSNYFGGITKGVDLLKFTPLQLVDLDNLEGLEIWIDSLYGLSLETLTPTGWFTRV